MPKSGTHLIRGVLDALRFRRIGKLYEYYGWPDDRHQDELSAVLRAISSVPRHGYLLGHFCFIDQIVDAVEARGTKILLMVRDPRDVVVSHVFHVQRREDSKFHSFYAGLGTMKNRLRVTIAGLTGMSTSIPSYWLPNISDRFEMFLPWREKDRCLLCRFEDLVGPEGGGSRKLQWSGVKSIVEHLEFQTTEKDVSNIAESLFSRDAATFRRGAIGAWKEFFDEETKDLFKETAQDLLENLGYEANDSW